MSGFEKKFQVQEFPVIKDYGPDEPFFRLQTPAGEARLQKIAFQKDQPLPDTLDCRVKGYDADGLPVLGHNMPRYVSEFYADGFSKGRDFEFKVVRKPGNGSDNYQVEDEYGLQFRVQAPKSALTLGQTIKCKFEVLDPTFFVLRRRSNDTQLGMVTLRDLSRALGLKQGIEHVERQARELPELAQAFKELDHGLPSWMLTAVRACRDLLPGWFSDNIARQDHEMMRLVLEGYRRMLLYLLEGSGFLRNLKGADRTSLQSELTVQIEQAEAYIKALRIIAQRRQNEFINNLLYHLKESGYIYHPTTQFQIMMILFGTSPKLVNSSLGRIFDALMGWYPDTWKAEPFRQAFVEQLEIYISKARGEIDDFLLPETADDNEKIEKTLTAIAIQSCLAIDSDNIDMRLNMSLFYRCLSLLRRAKAETLLNKSYLELMGVKLPTDFTWTDIKEPTMMMTRASVDAPSTFAIRDGASKYYTYDRVEVEVGPTLAIRALGDDAAPLVPNNTLPWLGMQVYSAIAHPMTRQKLKTIDGHAEFWTEVEQSLFQPKESKEYETARRMADIDDYVRIEVDRVITSASNPNHIEGFHCRIVDDHFFDGAGFMMAEDVATYNLHGVTTGTFRRDDGRPMQFEAKVIDIDANDNYRFSLIDQVRSAVRDMVYSGYKCYAVITKDNGRSYSAISDKGFGLYVNKQRGDLPYHCGNIVQCVVTDVGANNTVQAIAEEGPIDGMVLNNAKSLRNMLLTIAIPADDEDNAGLDLDDEDAISREDLREVIQLIRYKAISRSENIIEAFDYLSFARLLARIIQDSALAETIKAQKEILLQHQRYAKNKQVFRDDIEAILDASPESQLVSRMAARLLIVASLGHPEDNNELWAKAKGSGNEIVRELAKQVLSHNLLYEVDRDDITASVIKESIARTLNVSGEQNNLKYYGSESQYLEFKSSLVYPAQKGNAGISIADPDAQECEILHIIAGFLNTTGGTLFIGVNDDRYERGLEEDFKFYKLDTSERNTPHRRNIKSLDNMANYLQNVIDRSFSIGISAGDYAKVFVDDESSKGVIYVKVDPCPHVVYLKDTIYVRHGAKTTPLLDKESVDRFIADRKFLYKQQLQESAEGAEPEVVDVEPGKVEDELPVVEAERGESLPTVATEAEFAMPDYSRLQTSRVRRNFLHEYDSELFVTPAFYLRFVGDNEFIVTDDEWSLEDTDRIDLAISEEETNQYLLLVYEDDSAIKVPMREIARKPRNKAQSHFSERRLVFACPVGADDAVYSMHCNSKGSVYERLTAVADIEQGFMTSSPTRIMDIDSDSTPLWEVVPEAKTGEFANIKSAGLKRNQLGYLAKGVGQAKVSSVGAAENFYKKLSH
ncbi:MAG: ATP-binding protein [Muribaculaceae bacterium]|nr:ATP-binding protein [Muribaculaceae bacterium]